MMDLRQKFTNKVTDLYQQSSSAGEFAGQYLSHIEQLLKTVDTQAVSSVISLFEAARLSGNNIFFAGNGGSAATASHFANDIRMGTLALDKPFLGYSLTDSIPALTATANDYGFDDIFLNQLKVQFKQGDVLVSISASGNSKNLVHAVEWVNKNKGTSVGLLGFEGGKLASLCHQNLLVASDKGEYGAVEGLHVVLTHLISDYLMLSIRKNL